MTTLILLLLCSSYSAVQFIYVRDMILTDPSSEDFCNTYLVTEYMLAKFNYRLENFATQVHFSKHQN